MKTGAFTLYDYICIDAYVEGDNIYDKVVWLNSDYTHKFHCYLFYKNILIQVINRCS
jgi:hypothetical protein